MTRSVYTKCIYITRRAVKPLAALAFAIAAPAQAEEIGACRFDPATLSFAGNPVDQATCLLQHVGKSGVLSQQPLPEVIRQLLTDGSSPTPVQRDTAIALLPQPYGGYARQVQDWPVSRTAEGLSAAYFVIHDTSQPFYGADPFPADVDHDARVNSFASYVRPNPVAHIFLNREGQIWAGHDFYDAWRATKLESFVVGPRAKGRFVHVETVQPRRFSPGSTWLGDTLAPEPGFSAAQYRMLAALYVYASARAGHWLIPAQHATVDGGIPEAHDDPQNFELERFAGELARIVNLPRSSP